MVKSKPVLVLGVGNILLKDEGIGVHVVNALAEENLPPEVTLHDGGTAGIDLLELIGDAEKLIIVDAIDTRQEPGSVYRFRPEEVSALVKEHKTSLHQIDLFDTLNIARFLERCPETVIIAVQPKELDWGMELSKDVKEVLPFVVEQVKKEINLFIPSDN